MENQTHLDGDAQHLVETFHALPPEPPTLWEVEGLGLYEHTVGQNFMVRRGPSRAAPLRLHISSFSGLRPILVCGREVKKAKPHHESASWEENSKPSNPKDTVGINKVPYSVVPMGVLAEVAVGMFEGSAKYGRHNYRGCGVRASVYFDATMRHLNAWWEGEDMDPGTGGKLSHVTKAICSLMVLRDSMLHENLVDDRPPKQPIDFDKYNKMVEELRALHSQVNPKHCTEVPQDAA